MKCRSEAEWREIIDGTKTAEQIARECKVALGTVYYNAKRFNLPIYDPTFDETQYRGIPIDVLKAELKAMPISEVAARHGIHEVLLRGYVVRRNFEYVRVKKRSKFEDIPVIQNNKKIKRTGEAMDMIKTLLDFYTDASIARVFGYSKERIRQIRMEVKK